MAHAEPASVRDLSGSRSRFPGIVGADEGIPGGGIENPLNFQDVFIHSPALFHHDFSSIFSFKEKRGGEEDLL